MPPDNPMERLAALGRLLGEKAEEIGLDLQAFVPIPDLTGEGVHVVQGMFVVNMPAALDVTAGDDELGQELAGILQATEAQEKDRLREEKARMEQERADAARERMLAMREKLERGEGLFD